MIGYVYSSSFCLYAPSPLKNWSATDVKDSKLHPPKLQDKFLGDILEQCLI